MIPAVFSDIGIGHLRALIDQGAAEDQTTEYKRSTPSSADSEKVSLLLKPVCAFANSEGGDLILGMDADRGVATALLGIAVNDADAVVLSLDSMIRSSVEPPPAGVRIKAIQVEQGRFAFLVRVPKSWSAPHRVRGNRTFYGRGASGSFELDVGQLRQSFLLSSTLQQDVQSFRLDRIATIARGETPVRMRSGLLQIMHVLPLQSFTGTRALVADQFIDHFLQIAPPRAGNLTRSLGLEGMTVYEPEGSTGSSKYSQLFREGRMEYVTVFEPRGEEKNFPSVLYEDLCISAVTSARAFLARFEFGGPVYVGLTLLAAKGYELGLGQMTRFMNGDDLRTFDRSVLVFPTIEVAADEQNIGRALRPLFDHVWNAGGMARSLNYDEDGNWRRDGQR